MVFQELENACKTLNLNPFEEGLADNLPDTLKFHLSFMKIIMNYYIKTPNEIIRDIKLLEKKYKKFNDKSFFKIHIFKEIFNQYSQQGNFTECLKISKEYIQFAEKKSNDFALADALNKAGYSNLYLGDLNQAEEFYKKANEILLHHPNLPMGFTTGISLGYILGVKGFYKEAIEKMKETERKYKQLVPLNSIIYLYENLGSLYREIFDNKNAKFYLKKALKFAKRTHDKFILTYIYYNLASIFFSSRNYSKAREIYNNGLRYAEEVDDKRGILMGYISHAMILKIQNNFKEEQTFLLKAVQIAKEINSHQLIVNALIKYSNNRMNVEDYSSAEITLNEIEGYIPGISDHAHEMLEFYFLKGMIFQKRNQIEESLSFFEKALKIAKEINELKFIDDITKEIIKLKKAGTNGTTR
ncbi:MAG: hypothetical protein PHV06_04995 [bacterium]|nr:hypothetical protein [bacterium]